MTLSLKDATVPSENVIRLEFSEAVFLDGFLGIYDAARPGLYTVINDATTIGGDGQPCRPVTVFGSARPDDSVILDGVAGAFVDLTIDRALSPYPAVYALKIVGIVYTQDKLSSVTNVQRSFFGTYRELQKPTLDAQHGSRDLANPQSGISQDGIVFDLGTYSVSDDGDLAFDEGIANLKKRVFRRLMTKENGFAHLPGYGIGVISYGKKLAQNSVISGLISRAEAQLRSEPDLQESRVTADLSNIASGLLRLSVVVRTKQGLDAKWAFTLKLNP